MRRTNSCQRNAFVLYITSDTHMNRTSAMIYSDDGACEFVERIIAQLTLMRYIPSIVSTETYRLEVSCKQQTHKHESYTYLILSESIIACAHTCVEKI